MAASKTPHRPINAYRVPAMFRNLSYKLTSALSSPQVPTLKNNDEFTTVKKTDELFPTTDPAVDGDDCLHDCASCSIKYPRKFEIDETEELYGHVKGWSTHMIVATGKTDWVRDVADEEGSIMEAVGKGDTKPSNGKLMLSASDIPVPDHSDHSSMVLLLPSWQFIENVTPANIPEVITSFVNPGPTNNTPLRKQTASVSPPEMPSDKPSSAESVTEPTTTTQSIPATLPLKARPCPHKYLILMCSQKTRDARCGQSAPLLRKEFERLLRPMGLYRDLHDERPGGVGIYFISHVGGHKFSANVMIYRHSSVASQQKETNGVANGHVHGAQKRLGDLKLEDDNGQEVLLDANKEQEAEGNGEAAQCIWLARVKPEDCENIIKYTVLQGKVVKPERQLRGGFDRCKQLASW
ncbi:sucrase ferredoxin domain containing protein [Pyrenophora tritici-repentis]|uniref:Sucrase/ferredoxin domain containing protein n=2 Tax=Pyrenophora tritici-repentis TaxID=45151 RepID=A0A2W1FGJ2_9PLEO|nr:Sucrase/ferredoxin domain containing protein [Pyrenophora tritici-repentis]KAI0587092.1 Sucrase/ferredoxin domain-containing protein [Pyrenophora tritici-repentis]KAI0589356.1 Sucrase/ferredoxin domain-containing protein [Pyrenophora tritici-repentis]KAI0611347.1 Sucrase/ferredoxin domain-containing protein [Pyrenophora tritici-repentis]KAI0625916.1 Sucrase/ferredoxin domain-containing protein [Pyrenophora tritici-repentis]